MTISYSTTQLQLSKEAEDGLASIIEAYKADKDVYKACAHFFQLFGSHIAIGPLHYGGLVVFTCCSVNFEEKERNSILKLQEAILASTSNISEIDIDLNKYEHMCSEKTLTDTCLNSEMLLGHKTAASMEQFENKCITETDCWNLTDRGKQLVAIWELLALDHHFEEFGSVIDVLKESWERMTGLEATNDDIFSINSQNVATNRMKPSPILQKNGSNCMHSVVTNVKVPKSIAYSVDEITKLPDDQASKQDALQESFDSASGIQLLLASDAELTCNANTIYTEALSVECILHKPSSSQSQCTEPQAPSDTICNNKMLHLLGLNEYYTTKISLKEALGIQSNIIYISVEEKGCSNLHDLPFLVLYKLMSYDVNCQSILFSPIVKSDNDDNDNSSDNDSDYDDDEEEKEEEKGDLEVDDEKHDKYFSNEINPMDCLHALLLCCDDILCQDLFSRLAKCQLSVPFLMPDPIKKTFILPLWAMRSIIKEWTPHGQQQQSHSVVDYPMPIISFIKFGKHKSDRFSKSKTMNTLIGDLENYPFFHYNCSGGQYPQLFSKGLVDMSWYVPSGKPSDTFNDAITFLNLHGDAHQHPLQTEVLTQISSLCFVVITEIPNSKDMALFKKIKDSPCSFHILSTVKRKELSDLKKVFQKSKITTLIIKMTNKLRRHFVKQLKKQMKKNLLRVVRI